MLRAFVTFFVKRPVLTLALWVAAVGFGVLSYTTLLPREGFPSVDIPIATASGAYLVDDAEAVDVDVATPIATAVAELDEVESVSTFSQPSGFVVVTEFEASMASAEGAALMDEVIAGLDLPPEAIIGTNALNAAKFLEEFDLLVGVYGDTDTTTAELEEAAALLLPAFDGVDDVARVELVEQISEGFNPQTGEAVTQETDFNQFTVDTGDGLEFRPSIAIGVVAADGVDSLGIRDATDVVLADAEADGLLPAEFEAVVAIDFATQIRQQIGSLQSNVLTGVIAVAIVALLLISWRASIITGLFILTVLATTVGVLYLVGISLNTISLFGVILALGLFVDDAIVITEAIAANNDPALSPVQVARKAIGRVGTAKISGTVTTILVFAPMLMISGILGDFIRILPISVIVALSVSLVLAFVFIPVAARYLVMPAKTDSGLFTGVINRVADFVADLPTKSGGAGALRFVLAISLSIVMFLVGVAVFAPRVGFNIFPPQKDSTEINLEVDFAPGTSIAEAREISLEVNQQAADALGAELTRGYTYAANERGALTQLSLTPIGDRPTAPSLVDDVLTPLAEDYDRARVTYSQLSAGPPEALFPFTMQVYDEDVDTLLAAAQVMADELQGATITRANGTTFTVLETNVAFTDSVARIGGQRYVEVEARFDADDVTTTTARTQLFMEGAFDGPRLQELGLATDALAFDFGLESDNQESFSSLPIAFGVALLSMLVLLVLQFRSTVLWLLIFMAIPFSFFGVFGGLLLTGNVISFFVMLGLIGLIGIAVNNTILLTDYAVQERRAGHDRTTAIRNAVRRRFRPLVATSFTTVAGLLPLALSDPFWEGLGFTIIFGLLSSTFLVLISFPFYYLAFEFVRDRVRTPWRRWSEGAPLVDDSGPGDDGTAAVTPEGQAGDASSDDDDSGSLAGDASSDEAEAASTPS
ncbi:MAG: efflux RND transporter permease subunit [Actinomycetota bacterium]